MLNMGEQLRSSGGPGVKSGQSYEGVVVDNKDPLFLQRIRVRVSAIMDGWEDEHLPWAIPHGTDHCDGATKDTGTVNVPVIGSKVSVEFMNGQVTHPEYYGYHSDSTTVMEEAKYNYPNRKVFRFKDGTVLVVDKTDNVVYAYSPGTLKMHVAGNVELYVQGNVSEVVDGNVTRHVKGNVDETIDGNYTQTVAGSVNRKSASVNEKASGSVSYSGSSFIGYGGGSAGVGSGGTLTLSGATIQENGSSRVSAPSDPSSAAEAVLTSWPSIRKSK